MLPAPERWIRTAALAVCIVALPAVFGCSSSSLTTLWTDATFQSGPLKNVLVIAVRKDPVRQRLWEDAFVAELAARGTKATAAYRVFTAFPARPDTQQVIQAVRERGFDGVLVSHRLAPTTETREVSGYNTTRPETEFNPWTGRYETYTREVTTPGYVETTTVQSFETRVWAAQDGGRLVWAGVLKCTESVDADAVHDGVSNHIVPELARAGILPPPLKK